VCYACVLLLLVAWRCYCNGDCDGTATVRIMAADSSQTAAADTCSSARRCSLDVFSSLQQHLLRQLAVANVSILQFFVLGNTEAGVL
jgi:hypothetical protein